MPLEPQQLSMGYVFGWWHNSGYRIKAVLEPKEAIEPIYQKRWHRLHFQASWSR